MLKLENAGFWRRLGAYAYEAFPVVAILFLAGAVALAFHGGEAIGSESWWFRLYLVGWIYAYFVYCWTSGGQTLAMRAWRLHVRGPQGEALTFRQANLRFWIAFVGLLVFGLGHLWALLPSHRTWHDRVAGTNVFFEPKASK